MKKILILLMVLAVATTAFAGGGGGEKPDQAAPTKTVEEKAIKNPDTFIYATYGTIDSLDPAKAYDNASGGSIQNIYETLIDFEGSSTEKFIPLLATEVPSVANGLITNGGKTYTFPIRKGVKFHNGNDLTPEDVAYSFQRNLAVDPDGGPMWMIFEAFFGTYSSRDDDGNIVLTMDMLNDAIQVKGDSVVFNLAQPYAPFMSILAGYWGSIMDKEWTIEQGGWKGTAADIARANGPAEGEELLYDIANGTGPFKLSRWEKGVEIVFDRFDGYWGPKPAVQKAIYRVMEEWSTRKLALLQGDADNVQVDPMYYEEMDKEAGLIVYKDKTQLGVRAIHFNQKIGATDNPAIHSGKLDGQGVPPDFFTDKNVRLGFTYAWDLDTYINEIIANTGIDVPTPLVTGLPYFNPDLKKLPFDLAKAEEHFRKAWGGQVWEKGFEVDFLYNTGNEVRQNACQMLASNVMSLNPKFKVNVRGIEWATYLDMISNRTLPLFYVGWGADFPDPHNFMQPYMHSKGYYGGRCGYSNPEVDRLIEAAAVETDPAKRKQMYYRLQELYLEDAPGIILHQPVENFYFRDWVKGFVYHPMQNEFKYKMFTKSY